MATKLIPDQDFASIPNPNILTNGGFEIWQRGTSFANPANAAYTADKWQVAKLGSPVPTMSVDRESGVGNTESLYSMKLNCTSVGANQIVGLRIYQTLDSVLAYELRGKTITLSARIKTSTANKYRVGIFREGPNDRTYGNYHTGSGSFETLSVSVLVTTSTTGLSVELGMVELADITVSIAFIDSVMLVVGSVPVNFIPMHPADDLVRCQRYYEKANATTAYTTIIRYASSNQYSIPITFKVTKATVPTFTYTVSNLEMSHSPTTGNGLSGNDIPNWTAISVTMGVEGGYASATRNADQTVYPLLRHAYSWTAES